MEKVPKRPCIFFCQICDYKTCKKHQHDKHLLSSKHKSRTISNEKVPKSPQKTFLCKKYIYIFKIPRLFWNFHFWTFFLSIFQNSKKVLEKKNIKKIRKICYHKNSYGVAK